MLGFSSVGWKMENLEDMQRVLAHLTLIPLPDRLAQPKLSVKGIPNRPALRQDGDLCIPPKMRQHTRDRQINK